MVGGKLVRPVIPCRVCFWPVTRERLPTPGLESNVVVNWKHKCSEPLLPSSVKHLHSTFLSELPSSTRESLLYFLHFLLNFRCFSRSSLMMVILIFSQVCFGQA